jgi:hypothetical protein
MNYSVRNLVFVGILCVFTASLALASVKAIPLPELVKTSDAIITGRIIKMEKTEIREGVYEVICRIRVDSVLKGKPKTKDAAILKKTVATVSIQFYDGEQVPTGKIVYELGDEGIWFLSPIEKSKTGLYGAGARHNLASLDDVKRELQNK